MSDPFTTQSPAYVPAPLPVSRPRPRWLLPTIVVGGVALLVAAGIAVWLLFFTSSLTAAGTLTIVGQDHWQGSPAGGCEGEGGFSDLAPGASVVITDNGGKTVAIGRLEPATIVAGNCVFDVSVDGIPSGSQFYGISVGHRNVVQFKAEELAAFTLTIG